MKIRSAVPENGCLIFFANRKHKKTQKKQKKTSVKYIRYRLIGGCVNNEREDASTSVGSRNRQVSLAAWQFE